VSRWRSSKATKQSGTSRSGVYPESIEGTALRMTRLRLGGSVGLRKPVEARKSEDGSFWRSREPVERRRRICFWSHPSTSRIRWLQGFQFRSFDTEKQYVIASQIGPARRRRDETYLVLRRHSRRRSSKARPFDELRACEAI